MNRHVSERLTKEEFIKLLDYHGIHRIRPWLSARMMGEGFLAPAIGVGGVHAADANGWPLPMAPKVSLGRGGRPTVFSLKGDELVEAYDNLLRILDFLEETEGVADPDVPDSAEPTAKEAPPEPEQVDVEKDEVEEAEEEVPVVPEKKANKAPAPKPKASPTRKPKDPMAQVKALVNTPRTEPVNPDEVETLKRRVKEVEARMSLVETSVSSVSETIRRIRAALGEL